MPLQQSVLADTPSMAVHAYFQSTVASVFDSTIMAYDEATAAWLTAVTDAPREADLDHLSTSLLRDGEQPLGVLSRGFVRLFAELFHAGIATDYAEALQTLSLAARTFQLGATRLLGLVLDVLPPLRAVAATRVAEAIEVALFDEGVANTLQPLLRAASGTRDEAFGAQLDALADAPDADTLLCSRLGLEPRLFEAIAPAVSAARSMACCTAPHAKLRRFLVVCGAHGDACCADELIPACAAALVLARQRTLPSELLLLDLFVCDAGELLGPLGYGLATLHAAVGLIGLESAASANGDAIGPAEVERRAASSAGNDEEEEEEEDEEDGGDELREAILSHPRVRLTASRGSGGAAADGPSPSRPHVLRTARESMSPTSPPPPPPASPAVIVRQNVALAAEHGARWLDSLATAALSPTKASRRGGPRWGASPEATAASAWRPEATAASAWQAPSDGRAAHWRSQPPAVASSAHAPPPLLVPEPVRRALQWPSGTDEGTHAHEEDDGSDGSAVAATAEEADDEGKHADSGGVTRPLEVKGTAAAADGVSAPASPAPPHRPHPYSPRCSPGRSPGHSPAPAALGSSTSRAGSPSRRHRKQRLTSAGQATARTARLDSPPVAPAAASPRQCSPRARASSPRWALAHCGSDSPAAAPAPCSPGGGTHLGATPPTERRRRRKQRCSSGAATNRTGEVEAVEAAMDDRDA